MATKQKPLHHIRVGTVRASIWKQSAEEKAPFYTVTFSLSYKDKSDQWKNGHSYLSHDLEALIECAQLARNWIRLQR